MLQERSTSKSFIGLRGLALAGIVLHTAFPQVIRGGYLGYILAFTLLGYSWIQSYLLEEDLATLGRGAFKRAYPPLVVMVGLVLLVTALVAWPYLPWIRGTALAGVLGVSNWTQVYQGFSFFTPLSPPNPLAHTWALGLGLQFLLLGWVMTLGKKSERRIMVLALVLLVLVLASGIRMGLLYEPDEDPTRLFYGTDTMIFSFAIGGIFGIIGTQGLGQGPHDDKDMATGILLIVLVMGMIFLKPGSPSFLGGMVAYSLLSAILMVFISSDDNAPALLLSGRALTYLGKRAYHIYLYHLPLLVLAHLLLERLGLGDSLIFLIQVPILIILSEVSSLFLAGSIYRRRITGAALGLVALVLVLSMGLQEGLGPADISQAQDQLKKEARDRDKKDLEEEPSQNQGSEEAWASYIPPADLSAQVEQVNAQYPDYTLKNRDLGLLQDCHGVIIGDSVSQSNRDYYETLLPEFRMEAHVGLQVYQVENLIKSGQAGLINPDSPIIIQLGNDADFNLEDLDQVLQAADRQAVILVNIVSHQPWEDSVNDKLARAASQDERIFLLDWYSQAKGQASLFEDFDEEEGEEEKTVLSSSGQRLMTQMIGKKVLEVRQSLEEGPGLGVQDPEADDDTEGTAND